MSAALGDSVPIGVESVPRAAVRRRASGGVLDFAPVAAVAILLLAAALKLSIWAAVQPVSFDGAMNLEVARSLAEGHGYRRMYADHLGFSHAIQTRAPYILPAAAVYAAFGVGIWQSQLVNVLYLAALSLLVFVLVRRAVSWRWAIAAVAVCLCTPGFEDTGLNGFGEVPALTWWLAALAVLYGSTDGNAPGHRRIALAGVLVGIAVVTKTVLLIGVCALLPVLVVEAARQQGRVRPVLVALFIFGAGAVLPVVLHEICRALTFADYAHWKAWVLDEWHMIHMQAGTERGLPDSKDVASKVHTHFGVLVAGIGTAHGVVAAFLLLPALLLAGGWRVWVRDNARPLIATLALMAAIYLVWWLGVTPTEKAWYRRIFNGVLVWELMAVLLVGVLWKNLPRFSRNARIAFGVTATLSIAVAAALAAASFGQNGLPDADARTALATELAAVDRLPHDAHLYGIGWYSMPSIALYSGRRIGDLNDATSIELAARSPVFVLLDKGARIAGVDTYWLRRYANAERARIDDFRIVELTTDRVRDPFADVDVDRSALRGYADFHGAEYPYVFGFYDHEGDGWRWARSDVEAMLKYGGEQALKIDVYTPKPAYYRHGHLPSITAWVGDCKAGTMISDVNVRAQREVPLGACAPAVGDVVRVRLVADDVDNSNDGRQLSFVTHGFGFAATPGEKPSAAQ